MKFFICVIGGVMILEGLPYVAFPAKMKIWVQKLQEVAPETLQKVGFLIVVLGFSLIYLGLR